MLYASRNRLKKVPDSIGKLKNLQSLDLASNSLKELPWSALGALKKLKTLDLSANPKLIKIGMKYHH